MYSDNNNANHSEEEVNYNYGDDGEKPWLKIALAIVAIVVILLIIFLLLKGCMGGKDTPKDDNKEDILIKAAKEYYNIHENELPVVVGECVTVTLETLLNENLISKPALFDDCSKTNTYVTVCATADGPTYTATLSCGDKVKYYYPNDEKDASLVKEFYTSAPHPDYTLFDNETSGVAKWYTESTSKEYYNGYASEAPEGYPNKGDAGTSVTKVTINKPVEKEYRTIKGPITLYSTRSKTIPTTCSNPTVEVVGTPTTQSKEAYHFGYICARTASNCLGSQTLEIYLPNTCAEQPSLKYTCGKTYTCDGESKVGEDTTCPTTEKVCKTGKLSADGKKCVIEKCGTVYGSWSNWTTSKCIGNSDVCKTTSGYTYTDKVWKWFKAAGRSYYPSGNSDAALENTYYLEAPTSGAIKDLDTITTGFKYYKEAY